jgi:hypothetical protein
LKGRAGTRVPGGFDIFGGKMLQISQDGYATTIAEVEHWPTGLGWLPDGDPLIVSLKDRRLLRRGRQGGLMARSARTVAFPFS